jgi:hypothetical protein
MAMAAQWREYSSADFTDPAEKRPDLARLRDGDLMGLLDLLERLWDDGVLPQPMTPKWMR